MRWGSGTDPDTLERKHVACQMWAGGNDLWRPQNAPRDVSWHPPADRLPATGPGKIAAPRGVLRRAGDKMPRRAM
jgi:hypothetical protein